MAKPIKSAVSCSVPASKVWGTWKQSQYWDQSGKDFEKGQRGQAIGKRRTPFEVTDILDGRSFTLTWKAPFIKLTICHEVEPKDIGSLITYTMTFRGLMAPLVRLVLGRKVQRHLTDAVHTFSERLS